MQCKDACLNRFVVTRNEVSQVSERVKTISKRLYVQNVLTLYAAEVSASV